MQNIDPRIVEQFNKIAPFKLEDATILVLALIGSDSHGTKIEKDDPQSIDDTDYMGVVIPPRSYTFGLKTWENLNFQYEELDCVFYSFRKFITLLVKSNPNVLGLLWLNREHYVSYSDEWKIMMENRDSFSSLQAFDSFMGYANAQFKKMESFDLETQEEYELAQKIMHVVGFTKEDVISNKPLPMYTYDKALYISNMTAPSSENRDTIARLGWPDFRGSIDSMSHAKSRIEHSIESIKRIHARHFQGYMGEKRKNAVIKYGYDVKNAAHLIRLMRMCIDFLHTGRLAVYRTYDSEYLKDIKRGKFTIEEIKKEAAELFETANAAKASSTLPEKPNVEWIDNITQRIYLSAYRLT